MRLLIFASCALVACTAAPQQTKYTDKYDNINLDEILSNNRLLMPYLECVLEKGRCNAEGKELKEHLKDALETGCSKCTERQEQGAYKIITTTMKIPLLLGLVIVVVAEDKYTSRYDNTNLDSIITNKRILLPYVRCILDQGKCSQEAAELKVRIRDALRSGCEHCTERQRNGAKYVIKHLILHEPVLWKQITDKYNTEGSFVEKYEKEARIEATEEEKIQIEKPEDVEGLEVKKVEDIDADDDLLIE